MTTEADIKPQNTLRMTENQCNYVALAQRVHNSLMAEGQALVNQGNAKAQEGQQTLRQAVEGAFKEHGQTIPTAEVRIVNDERGRPAVLVWTDPPAPAEASEGESVEEADEKPKAVNGKTPPEAIKRRLPIK